VKKEGIVLDNIKYVLEDANKIVDKISEKYKGLLLREKTLASLIYLAHNEISDTPLSSSIVICHRCGSLKCSYLKCEYCGVE